MMASDSNDTAEGRQKNRAVEIEIRPPYASASQISINVRKRCQKDIFALRYS